MKCQDAKHAEKISQFQDSQYTHKIKSQELFAVIALTRNAVNGTPPESTKNANAIYAASQRQSRLKNAGSALPFLLHGKETLITKTGSAHIKNTKKVNVKDANQPNSFASTISTKTEQITIKRILRLCASPVMPRPITFTLILSCMECPFCKCGHNEDICPECGSTCNLIDEIESDDNENTEN